MMSDCNMCQSSNAMQLASLCSKFLESRHKIAAGQVIAKDYLRTSLFQDFFKKVFKTELVALRALTSTLALLDRDIIGNMVFCNLVK